jgi:hypothetical protein
MFFIENRGFSYHYKIHITGIQGDRSFHEKRKQIIDLSIHKITYEHIKENPKLE